MNLDHIKEKLINQKESIDEYFVDQTQTAHLPLYASVDIRINSIKTLTSTNNPKLEKTASKEEKEK